MKEKMKKIKKDYTKVLEKCISIAKTRQKDYGEATDSIKLANRILNDTFGVTVSDKDLCKVIIALKLSREKVNHKDDNILDIINYLAIMQSI